MSSLDLWHKAKHVNLASLCAQLGLPLDTYTNPIRVKCPFHEDGDTFNLTIHPTGRSYHGPHLHCYGCNWNGSAIDLVRDYLNMSDREAVEYILERPLPEVKREPRPEDVPTKDMTAAFANANLRLFGPHGDRAREYLDSRGIDAEMCKRYMLGVWATDTSRWSGRITIPHLRLPGQPVMAGKGRSMDGADPKYLATKGAAQSVYLGDLALSQDGPVVIVEGELDAISLGGAMGDVIPVCAVPGVNNFSRPEAFMGRVVYVVLDNDEAGEKARNGYWMKDRWYPGIPELLSEAGAYPITVIPQMGDLNEMLQAYGKEGLRQWFSEEMEAALAFR